MSRQRVAQSLPFGWILFFFFFSGHYGLAPLTYHPTWTPSKSGDVVEQSLDHTAQCSLWPVPRGKRQCVCALECLVLVRFGGALLFCWSFFLFCLIFLESLDVNFRSFLSVPLLGLRFNEASRDERRVVCGGGGGGDASKCTKDVAAAPSQSWEKPLLLFFPPEMLSQVVVYKSNQVNAAWEVVPVFGRTQKSINLCPNQLGENK